MIPNSNKFILILLVLLCTVLTTSAAQLDNIAGLATYTVKSDMLNSYQNRAVYLDKSTMQLYISGISTLATRERKRNHDFWISKINTIDGIATEINLNNIKKNALNISDIQCILTTNDRNMIATITEESGQSALISINIDGEVKQLSKLASETNISKIFSTADNNLVLIGSKSLKSFVMKINNSGNEIWSKVFDRGEHEIFVDGVPTDDNGFILIENSGKFEKFFMGQSNLFVTIFDSNGNKVDERFLPGRYGSIAHGKDGGFVVVYDKKADSSQDMWVQAYDKHLNPLWSQNITSAKFGLGKFKTAGLANGNYVVAGTVKGKPWVTYLDGSNGTKRWDYLSTSQDFENSIDIVANGDDAYLVSTVIRLNADKALNNKVKLIKFQPK